MLPAFVQNENQAPGNEENSQNVTPVRTRKLWVDHEPYTPPQDIAVEEQVTLKLTHFGKKPIVDFGSCKINKTVVRELVIDNCNNYEVDVIVERFPYKKHFNISKKRFSIDGNSSDALTISWTPKDAGNYREMGLVNYEGFRLQFLLLGIVKEKLIKRRRRPLRPLNQDQNLQNSVPSTQSPAKGKVLNEAVYQRSTAMPLREIQTGFLVAKETSTTVFTEPAHSSPAEVQLTPADVTVNKDDSGELLETPPTIKKIPSSSKPDFEYFQFKDHLQQSLGRPTFVVSQTPPSELPAFCADQGLKPVSHDSTPTGRPTIMVTDALNSDDQNSAVVDQDSLDEHDRLIQSFHERVCRQGSTGDGPDILVHNSTQILHADHTVALDSQLNSSLHSNTSTATYVIGENQEDCHKTGSKRKSLSSSAPKKAMKSPKMDVTRKKGRATPDKSQRRSKGLGTPKGKTIQKLRASKAGRAAFPSPKKLSSRRSMPVPYMKETLSPGKNKRRSKVMKQPTLAGIKRAAVVDAKKPTKKKIVKGVPMAHLVLKSDSKVVQRRHPLTYASRNQFYDAKWRVKQERALACWANYVLTPDEFKPSQMNGDASAIDVKILASAAKVQPAMSKEMASLRAYRIGCRLNSLRRAACNLFLSTNITNIIQKVEQEVDTGRLKVRSDRPLWKDLGCRRQLLGFLMNFHSIWLRLGLEAVFGETVPVPGGDSPSSAVARFIKHRLLHDDDIAQTYAHPTVPHSYRSGFEDELGKHTLKKILVLVYFLDQAKGSRLIDHDPCLFEKGAKITSCRELLINISREFLSGEGDIVKHLSYLGYHVSHQQSYLDEFEYGIHNIAVDLRDGIRLTRMTEILFHDWSLSSKLRFPPGSLLQKRHNTGVAIKALGNYGICTKDDEGKPIETEHIVNGNCDKTLSLIWNIAAHFQLVNAVNCQQVEDEISFLQRTLKLKQTQFGQEVTNLELDAVLLGANTDVEKTSAILLKWCKYVCAHHGVDVHNFVNSFADGQVMATLISHYQPQLIAPTNIRCETTLNMGDVGPDEDISSQSSRENYLKLQKNEKANFLMVKKAVYELGGIPSLICIDDFCGTIPDSKVVRLLVACLCTRLIDVRVEERAARIIQISWANYIARKKEKLERERIKELEEKAATCITSFFKAWICRKRFLKEKHACQVIQSCYRGYQATKLARAEFIAQRRAAIRIQTNVRMVLAKLLVKRLMDEQALLQLQTNAVIVLQRMWRHYRDQKLQHKSALVIQTWFRYITARQKYLNLRKAVTIIQQHWRATAKAKHQMEKYACLRSASIILQAHVRQHLARNKYLAMRRSVLIIQAHRRGCIERRKFLQIRASVCAIQCHWRAYYSAQQYRSYFQMLRQSVIKIQCLVRGWLARKHYKQAKQEFEMKTNAAIRIQSAFKAIKVRQQYLLKRNATMKIQSWYKGICQRKFFVEMKLVTLNMQRKFRANILCKQEREDFLHFKENVIKMQALRRATLCRREFCHRRKAAIIIQSCYKGSREKRRYAALKHATATIQKRHRANMLCKEQRHHYQLLRHTIIRMQAIRRGTNCRSNFLKTKQSAIKIQSWFKGLQQRCRYSALKACARTLQTIYRTNVLAKQQRNAYTCLRRSVIRMQAMRRGTLCRRRFREMQKAVVKIQSWYRSCLQQKRFQAIKSATYVLQSRWKAFIVGRQQRNEYIHVRCTVVRLQAMRRKTLCRRKYLIARSAAVTIQAHVRGLIAKRDYTLKQKSAVKLQALFRQILYQNRYLKLRLATICLQQHWRAVLLGRETREMFVLKKTSAIKLQDHWRGFQQRQRYLQLRKAALTIQTHFKATIAAKDQRNVYLSMKASCIKIQSLYRGHVAMKHFLSLQELKAEETRKINAATLIQSIWRCHITRSIFLKQKHAAIKIKSCFKAFRQRKSYKQLCTAVIMVQQKWKAVLISRKVWQRYQTVKANIIKLQSIWRGTMQRRKFLQCKAAATIIQAHVKGWRERNLYNITRYSIVKIQALYRGYMVRKAIAKQNQAARCIQALWSACVLRREAQKDFKDLQHAALICQSHYRGVVERRKYVIMRTAAQCIQRQWRAKLLGRQIQTYYCHLKKSCIVIQAWWRGCVARDYYNKLKQTCLVKQAQNKAAVVIQAAWRGAEQQRKYTLAKNSSIKIQAWYRGIKQCQKFVALCVSITRIQTQWRATLLSRKVRKQFLEYKLSAVCIQAMWRGTRQRRKFQNLRKSVIMLQAFIRGSILRKKFVKERDSVVKVQALARGKQARKKFLEIRNAVITLQKYWRATLLAKTSRLAFLKKKKSAVVIQAAYHGWVSRKKYQAILEEVRMEKAAVLIQSFWKSYQARQRFLLARNSAVKIQSWFRGCIQQHRYLHLYNSTVLLQRKWRAVLQGCVYRKKFLEQKSAAVAIQSLYKATVQRRKFLKHKSAAVTVQSYYRAWSARRSYTASRRSAIQIQAWFRGVWVRNEYKQKLQAISCIQQHWRAYEIGQNALKEYRKMKSAAVCIQAWWKGTVQHQEYIKLKSTVTFVQTHWRAKVLGRDTCKRFRCIRESCLKIQACYRGYAARLTYQKLLELHHLQQRQNQAALLIQKIWRGYLQRMEFHAQRNAAIVIQSHYKALKQRKKFVTVIKSVMVIQSKWKATLLGNKSRQQFLDYKATVVTMQSFRRMAIARKKFLTMQKSATLVQACFRGYMARSQTAKQLSSVVKIQALVRAHQARHKFKIIKQAAILIQICWRSEKFAKETRNSFLQLKASAIVVQSAYRGYAARKQFKHLKERYLAEKAAVVLQSWYRGCRQRQAYALLLEKKAAKRKLQLLMISLAARDHMNAIIIQRAYRRSVARAHYKAKIQQVVKVQQWWKAIMAKRLFQKMRKSATIIQRHFRRHLLHRQFAAVVIQKNWRMHAACKFVNKKKAAILCIQATWRGYRIRHSQLQFPAITYRRQRIEEASKRASLHPENTLHNRMARALHALFSKKYLNQIRIALEELEHTSKILGVCCEHIAKAGGTQILFRLFSVCSRDFAAGSIICPSMKILSNLLSHPPSAASVKEIMGQHIDELVNVFAKFQDRGGRDKSNRPVFVAACKLLLLYLSDSDKAKDFVLNHQVSIQRLKSIQKETERRYNKENQRTGVQRRMSEIHKICYLNDSSMVAEQSFVKERSFVCGMLGTMASTSTPSRKTAPKLPEQATKPKTTRQSKAPTIKVAPSVPAKARCNAKPSTKAPKSLQPLKPTENIRGPTSKKSSQPLKSNACISPKDTAEEALLKITEICGLLDTVSRQ